MAVSRADLRAGARALGLSGRPLCVHSSLRSFGRVEGGPEAVLAALLDEGCTVVVPVFTYAYEMLPPPGTRPPRNAFDYAYPPRWPAVGPTYDPSSNAIEADMGAIPRALLAAADRVRGRHAHNAFAALGPLARALIERQAPEDVYAPLRALAERGGAVLLIGVGLTRLTLLHWAEQLAGRELFRRWAMVPAPSAPGGAAPASFAVGGCSGGFEALEPAIGHLARETRVGASRWRAFPARETVGAAAASIRRDPAITHCPDPACVECAEAIAGGPILDRG